jgi:hypothetical protein
MKLKTFLKFDFWRYLIDYSRVMLQIVAHSLMVIEASFTILEVSFTLTYNVCSTYDNCNMFIVQANAHSVRASEMKKEVFKV